VTPRDPQAELEWAEFAGWMEAQGLDAGDDGAVYGLGDMIEAFTAGMQAQRALDAARTAEETRWRLRLAGERDEARSDYRRLCAVLAGSQSDAAARKHCLAIIETAGTPSTAAPLSARRAHQPPPGRE
jgi:hypothetical protein